MVGAVQRMGVFSGLEVVTELDPTAQPFLDHHRIDGTAVLPGVMGIEAFAEVARLVAPELEVAAIEDVTFRAPFKFYRDEPRAIVLRARPRAEGDEVLVRCELLGRRVLAGQDEAQETTHFTATVRLAPDPPAPPEGTKPPDANGASVDRSAIYDVYFHGPAYQVLDRAWTAGDVAVGRLTADLPTNHRPPERRLVAAPRLIELVFQTAGLVQIARDGVLGLPTAVGHAVTYGDPATASGALFALVRPTDEGGFDGLVVDDSGTVFASVAVYRTTALPDPLPAEQVAPFEEAMV
jgi:hypothetical protein